MDNMCSPRVQEQQKGFLFFSLKWLILLFWLNALCCHGNTTTTNLLQLLFKCHIQRLKIYVYIVKSSISITPGCYVCMITLHPAEVDCITFSSWLPPVLCTVVRLLQKAGANMVRGGRWAEELRVAGPRGKDGRHCVFWWVPLAAMGELCSDNRLTAG